MIQRLRTWLTWLAVLVLLVAVVPPSRAQAATASDLLTEDEAIEVLRKFDIVRGDPSGNLLLNNQLTRAEAAAVFVRVMGMEQAAKLLSDAVPFTDARGHWGAGEIAMAERLGLMRGDGNGQFRPNSPITYAEVLTVLLRMVDREPTGAWEPGKILLAAFDLNIVPDNITANGNALRGKLFWSLAQTTHSVKLPSGRSILQTYMGPIPPTVTLDSVDGTTSSTRVTISGTASDALRVYVNDNRVTYNKNTKRFSQQVDLTAGRNTIRVTVVDHAGNSVTETVVVERIVPVSSLKIDGPKQVKVGSSTQLTVTALGTDGRPVALDDVEVTITGDVATFNLNTLTLRAGNKTGRGTLTLRSSRTSASFTFDVVGPSDSVTQMAIATFNSGRGLTPGQEVEVQVQMQDSNGRVVTSDYYRNVTLRSSGLSGVTITPTTAVVEAGVAKFKVKGSNLGSGTLTASSSGLEDATAALNVLSDLRVVLSTTSNTALRPDGTSTATIRATLQDANGRSVTNTSGSDIIIWLTATGTDGDLTTDTVTIRRNSSSSSGNDAVYKVGVQGGTVNITGRFASSHDYSIQPLQLNVTGSVPGAKLQFQYPTTRQTPNGSATTITVRVLDANNRLVTAGSYAFQFSVRTSNNEPVVAGLPEGVQFNFAGTHYKPVVTNTLDGDVVVGRTHQGVATLELRYDKSGTVTITPANVTSQQDAYHPSIGFGPAIGSNQLSKDPFSITFAGQPSSVELLVDSTLGKDLPGGAVNNTSNMTIRAKVLDATGAPVPGYSEAITLVQTNEGDKVTSISGSNRRTAVNGVAEFTIRSSGAEGFDVYSVSISGLPTAKVTVAVKKDKAELPTVAAVRGVTEGSHSPVVGFVGPDADYLDIQLHRQPSPDGAPHNWAVARVYRKGESSPFVSGIAVDLNSPLPTIRVPKSALRAGRHVYEVALDNGAGYTNRSPDLGLSEAVNAVYNNNYRLTSANFNGVNGRLTLTGGGLSSSGIVSPELLTIQKDTHRLPLDSSVEVVSVSSSTIVLDLGGLAYGLDPDVFHGNVTLQADIGWFKSADETQVAQAVKDIALRPMAVIEYATLDEAAKRLYLHGVGFSQGTLNVGLIKIGDVALRPGTSSTSDRIASSNDGLITINLSNATLDALVSLPVADAYVTAEAGWLRVGSSTSSNGQAVELTGMHRGLYMRANITSVSYSRTNGTITIRGTGLDGVLSPNKLVFKHSSSNNTWRPNANTAVTKDGDNLVLTLSSSEKSSFESTFGGRQVILNTDPGWLVDDAGRSAAPLPANTVLFTVPAR